MLHLHATHELSFCNTRANTLITFGCPQVFVDEKLAVQTYIYRLLYHADFYLNDTSDRTNMINSFNNILLLL